MIYVDEPFHIDPEIYPDAPRVFKNNDSAHLLADSEEELVAYAVSIGMKANWLQDKGRYTFHFDVTGKHLRHVLTDNRVKKLTRREFGEMLIARRQAFLRR